MEKRSCKFWIIIIVILAIAAGVWYSVSKKEKNVPSGLSPQSSTVGVATASSSDTTTATTWQNINNDLDAIQTQINQLNSDSAAAVESLNSSN